MQAGVIGLFQVKNLAEGKFGLAACSVKSQDVAGQDRPNSAMDNSAAPIVHGRECRLISWVRYKAVGKADTKGRSSAIE